MRSAYVFARVYECKPCIYVRVDVRKTKRYKLVTHACTFVWPTGATVPLLCSLVYVCVCVWTSARNTSCNSAECEHVKHRLYPRVRACVTFVGGARMSSHFSTRLFPSRQERFRFVSNFWHLSYFSFFLSFSFSGTRCLLSRLDLNRVCTSGRWETISQVEQQRRKRFFFDRLSFLEEKNLNRFARVKKK